jgi:hypothetical protein
MMARGGAGAAQGSRGISARSARGIGRAAVGIELTGKPLSSSAKVAAAATASRRAHGPGLPGYRSEATSAIVSPNSAIPRIELRMPFPRMSLLISILHYIGHGYDSKQYAMQTIARQRVADPCCGHGPLLRKPDVHHTSGERRRTRPPGARDRCPKSGCMALKSGADSRSWMHR